MNVTITFKKTVYEETDHRNAGSALQALILFEDGRKGEVTEFNSNLYNVADKALRRVHEIALTSNLTGLVITVNPLAGYTLNAGFKAQLSDRYVVEPEIDTITFA